MQYSKAELDMLRLKRHAAVRTRSRVVSCVLRVAQSACTLLGFTNRGFNTFKIQVGLTIENAFGGTGETFYGDLQMTVLRHEAAHQFDLLVLRESQGLSVTNLSE